MKEKMIKQYVRNKKNVPIGVLVAIQREEGIVGIGYSLCHKSDQFSKEKGTLIASNRAMIDKHMLVPDTIVKPLMKFTDRAMRYFFPKYGIEVSENEKGVIV